MKTPLLVAAAIALSLSACDRRDPGALYGVRLGDAMSTARDHLATSGDGRWESEAGSVPALTWTATSPTAAPLRRARLEFHKGALVAARFFVSADAPEASGPPLVLTSVQVIARDPAPDGGRAVTVLSLDCPEHADEVKALVQRAKSARLVENRASVPASNFRKNRRLRQARTIL